MHRNEGDYCSTTAAESSPSSAAAPPAASSSAPSFADGRPRFLPVAFASLFTAEYAPRQVLQRQREDRQLSKNAVQRLLQQPTQETRDETLQYFRMKC